MSNIVQFKKAGLPSGEELSTALTNFSNTQEIISGPGDPILKLTREGQWVYGQEAIEVEDDSEWAVNTYAIEHGFVCWGGGAFLGERMVPFTHPAPDVTQLPPHTYVDTDKKSKTFGETLTAEWSKQLSLMLKCTKGDDEGQQVVYKTNSFGGTRAIQELIQTISQEIEDDPSKPIAVVSLEMDHYQHKQYGKVYTPELVVQDMVGVEELNETEDDIPDDQAIAEAAVEDAPPPQTSSKKKASRKSSKKSERRTRSRG